MSPRRRSGDLFPRPAKALPNRMGIPRQHRLDPVTRDLGEVGIVDADGAQVRDVAVAALVGAYV